MKSVLFQNLFMKKLMTEIKEDFLFPVLFHMLVEDRWLQIFQNFTREKISYSNILKLVEFSLSLPGTNASIKRVFSLMNSFFFGRRKNTAFD